MKKFSFCRPVAGHAFPFFFSWRTLWVGVGIMMAGTTSGQTLNVTPTHPPTGAVDFQIGGLPWELAVPFSPPIAPPNFEPTVEPFYWIFTIFGNGDYSPRMERTKTNFSGETVEKFCWENYPHTDSPDETTGFLIPTGLRGTDNGIPVDTSFPYIYPPVNYYPPGVSGNITYNPVSFIIARKGDPPPPPPLLPPPPPVTSSMVLNNAISFNSNGLNGGALMPPTIPFGDSIYLAHSHGYLESVRGHNQSAFIISYKPCGSNGGRVHVFYGQKRNGNHSSEFIESSHLSYDQITEGIDNWRLPNYYDNITIDNVSIHPNFTSPSSFARHDYIEFSSDYVSGVRSAIGEASEFRFFDFVRYLTPSFNDGISQHELGTNEWSYALAVLTSTDLNNCGNSLTDLSELDVLFSDFIAYNPQEGTLYDRKIVGYDDIYLRSGEPTDPNHIEITKVCVNSVSDTFVYLRLQFANHPNATGDATSSEVRFNVLDSNFEWCGLDGNTLECPLGNEVSIVSCWIQAWWQGKASYTCSDHSIVIYKNLEPGDTASINVILKLKAGIAGGILKYLHDHQILEASITLCPNLQSLEVRNELFPKYGSLSADCPETVCESCPSVFNPGVIAALATVLVVAAITGVVFWFRRKRRS
ncbi:MAG: hypothetical protein ACKVT2_04935 [Saprospiraceae bacterium]